VGKHNEEKDNSFGLTLPCRQKPLGSDEEVDLVCTLWVRGTCPLLTMNIFVLSLSNEVGFRGQLRL
jgi:hypothetical protein